MLNLFREIQKMGMINYIKNICSKYQEMEKNNFLTSRDAVNMMKVCKELVRIQKVRNLEPNLETTMINREQVRFNLKYKIHLNILKIIYGKVHFFYNNIYLS